MLGYALPAICNSCALRAVTINSISVSSSVIKRNGAQNNTIFTSSAPKPLYKRAWFEGLTVFKNSRSSIFHFVHWDQKARSPSASSQRHEYLTRYFLVVIRQFCAQFATTSLHSLILAYNQMGDEGLISICSTLVAKASSLRLVFQTKDVWRIWMYNMLDM